MGTPFAYCEESGFTHDLKAQVRHGVTQGQVKVMTDPRASPTGYPFKIVEIEGVNSRAEGRKRCCDLGYLRTAYKEESGRLGYRCAAEPVDTYLKRGGLVEDTEGRKCLCNGLFANIWHSRRSVTMTSTSGPSSPAATNWRYSAILRAKPGYTASDVIDHLLSLPIASNGHLNGSNGHVAATTDMCP